MHVRKCACKHARVHVRVDVRSYVHMRVCLRVRVHMDVLAQCQCAHVDARVEVHVPCTMYHVPCPMRARVLVLVLVRVAR